MIGSISALRVVLWALLLGAAAAQGAAGRYAADYAFLKRLLEESAPVRAGRVDWSEIQARFEPRFEACRDDRDHIRLVMELLATLGDGHSGVMETKIRDGLPSKADGLFGAGLWLGYEEGRVVLLGAVAGHPLLGEVPLGSALIAVDGLPMWWLLDQERRRITRFQGVSSIHSLFASLAARLLPFGDAKTRSLTFMLPDGQQKVVSVLRFSPDGKGFQVQDHLPPGITRAELVSAGLLPDAEAKGLAYLRIAGGMNAPTAARFHAALDPLGAMSGLLLDGRGAGGGSDAVAWDLAGRFFPEGRDNGVAGRIEKSGTYQFKGPLVLLTDETMVSAAETFTWALVETERAISVGRATGGWAIIPRRATLPSGLAEVRVGMTDRLTPIRGLFTEGTGFYPDVRVRYGPIACGHGDPIRVAGLRVLKALRAGAPEAATRRAFAALHAGDLRAFRQFAKTSLLRSGLDPEAWAQEVSQDLQAEARLERALLDLGGALTPDALGARLRGPGIVARAKAAGHAKEAAALQKALEASLRDAAAQEDLLAMEAPLAASEAARAAWRTRHGKTLTARFVDAVVWPRAEAPR